MEESRLGLLSDRIAARLDEDALTRYQLIDIATVMMFIQRYLYSRNMVQNGTACHNLDASLEWIRNHAAGAAVPELRARLTTAVDAVSHILGREASRTRPETSRVSS